MNLNQTAHHAEILKQLQAPLKARYREDARAAQWVLKASGRVRQSALTCDVPTHAGNAPAGLHPAAGGDGTLACSGDMLLEALAGCAGVTLAAVATALGITLRDAAVRAEGDLDFRGTLGVDKGAPVGFSAIRLHFDIDADAQPADLERLVAMTERYCVVLQTLAKGVPVTAALNAPQTTAA
ncbi:MAG TPA: OsmC family protein [Usitatibacteraceae bacterium]|nr:OsmC family protein [Usitatibacteraceae bacterium]